MKKRWIIGSLLLLIPSAYALESLRGSVSVDESNANNVEPYNVIVEDLIAKKNYRQQPPLVPHQTDKYQINLKVNQCLRCHEWPYNTDYRAPKTSETHYVNSQTNERTDKVSAERWFCTQCHVAQTLAPELIENTFKSSDDM